MINSKKLTQTILSVLLVGIGLFHGESVKAQFSSDSTGMYFSNLAYGARSISLANTDVSDSYSLEGIYTNPAAFLFSENNFRVSSNFFHNTDHNVTSENLNAIITRSNQQFLAVGTSFHHNNPSGFTLAQPKTPVQFNQFGASVFYASLLTSTLSIGGGLSGVYGYTEDDWDWGITSNLGLFYAPSTSVSYGLAYSGVGGRRDNLGAGLWYAPTQDPGSSEEDELDNSTVINLARAPHRLDIGATFRFPAMSPQPNFKISFANEKIFGEPGLIYKVGLEIFPSEIIALRGGYLFSQYLSGLRLGLGFMLENLTVDYSFAETTLGVQGYSHQLGVSISLPTTN